MAADPRIERLKIAFEDNNQNSCFLKMADKKQALDYLRGNPNKTGLAFRPNPEDHNQYLLIIKADHRPFIPSEDILIEITAEGYVFNSNDGKLTYPTLPSFLHACRNFADGLDDNPDDLPNDEDLELGRRYFEENSENLPKGILDFLAQNKLTKENLTCGIKYELMKNPMLGPEAIHYDSENIAEWLNRNGTSPNSRIPMTMNDFTRDVKVTQAIKMIIVKAKELEQKAKQEAIEREEAKAKQDAKEKQEALDKLKAVQMQNAGPGPGPGAGSGPGLAPTAGVLLFSNLGDQKLAKEEVKIAKEKIFTFNPPSYTFDENRNLFNLVLAVEALMDQFPDKEKGFKPRIEMDVDTGALTVNFAGIKHGWKDSNEACLQFLDALKNAGVVFSLPPLVDKGIFILQGINVIRFARFCKMPEGEIEFMYSNRALDSLYDKLMVELLSIARGPIAAPAGSGPGPA